MKLLCLTLLSSVILLANFLAPIAARADVIVFDDVKSTAFAVALKKEADGQTYVAVADCPGTRWVDSLNDCSALTSVFAVSEFQAFVEQAILNFSAVHRSGTLDPLTHENLLTFSAAKTVALDPKYSDVVTQLKGNQKDLIDAQTLLQHMPDSQAYQAHVAYIQGEITRLTNILNDAHQTVDNGLQIDQAVKDISASLLDVITHNNPQDQKPTYYAESKMGQTLIHEVMQQMSELIHSNNFSLPLRDFKDLQFFTSYLNYLCKDDGGKLTCTIPALVYQPHPTEFTAVLTLEKNGFVLTKPVNYDPIPNTEANGAAICNLVFNGAQFVSGEDNQGRTTNGCFNIGATSEKGSCRGFASVTCIYQ